MAERRLRPSLLSLFWTPVVAVGSHGADGRLNAQIAVSVFGASIVPERARLLCVLYKTNFTHELVTASGSLAVSALEESQTEVLHQLGFVSGRDVDKLAGLEVETTALGNPVLTDSLGWADCEVIESYDLGDATAFLAAVREVRELRDGVPLVWSKVRRELPQEWQDEWDRKIASDMERSLGSMRWSEPQ